MAGDPARALWLVDGFNVLHAGLVAGGDRGRWWRREERGRLLALAERFDDPAAEIVVVFDGARPAADAPEPPRRVRVVFAPSADAWLLSRLGEAPEAERVTLVTRDRRLAARARDRGAQVVSPRSFLARCGAAPEPDAA